MRLVGKITGRSCTTALGALAAAGLLVLTLPGTVAASDRSDTVIVAHRGASAYAPENTLAAVEAAADLRITWVENDVQRTKDGELVVLHDNTLERTTNAREVFPNRAPWKVADFTLAEIQRLDAGSWFDPKFAGEQVPTLADFLDALTENNQKLLLELKSPELYPGIERDTIDELAAAGWLDQAHAQDRLIIQSFNADSMRRIHELRPVIKTGFLGMPGQSEIPAYAEFVDQINPNHTKTDAAYVDAVHAVTGPHGKPLEVCVWTVDDGPTAARLVKAGVDCVITNKPDVIRDALGAGR